MSRTLSKIRVWLAARDCFSTLVHDQFDGGCASSVIVYKFQGYGRELLHMGCRHLFCLRCCMTSKRSRGCGRSRSHVMHALIHACRVVARSRILENEFGAS